MKGAGGTEGGLGQFFAGLAMVIAGGYLFTIVGEGFDGSKFRFDDLEIVP